MLDLKMLTADAFGNLFEFLIMATIRRLVRLLSQYQYTTVVPELARLLVTQYQS